MDAPELVTTVAAGLALTLWTMLFVPLLRERNREARAWQPRETDGPPPPPEHPAPALPLPERTVVDCRWQGSVFDGRCAPKSGRPDLRVRGATWRGEMHAAVGEEGQDAAGAAWDAANGVLYLAVADGLGSLPKSGSYARHAVTAALQLCRTREDDQPFEKVGTRLLGAIVTGMRRSFGREAGDDGGTTLVVAEVIPDGRGARVTVHGVGDSEAWLLSDKGWEVLHHERDPEQEENATRDLPNFSDPRTITKRVPPGGVLLLATDGFACRLNSTAGRSPQRLAQRLRAATSPIGLAHLVATPENGDEDDRAVVAVWVS